MAKISAKLREKLGSNASKRARREGLIPAVIYGSSVDSTSVTINRKEFEAVIKEVGNNGIFTVEVEGGDKYNVFLKDQDNAALSDIIYHVDLQAFSAGEKVVMTIPVYLENAEAIGEAIANQSLSEIEIEVEPAKAPESIYVDLTGMEIGDVVSVSDLDIDESIEVLDEPDMTVVSISAPEEVAEAVDPDAEVEEAPEVIGESDDEEEETEEE